MEEKDISAETSAPHNGKPKKPKKRFIATQRRNDGSICAFVLHPDTDHPKLLTTRAILKGTTYFASFLVFFLTAVISVYYVVVASKGEFHADCTDTIMWANGSYETGKMYDPDFKYACFLPFGTNIIMLPFLHIFGLSLTTHIIGMAGFFLILTFSLFIMQKHMGAGLRGSLLGTSFFLALTMSSKKLREIFWGHTIYYTLGILFLVIGMAFYFRLITISRTRRILSHKGSDTSRTTYQLTAFLCLLCIFIMLTATDGISAISIFTLPFIAAIAAEYLTDSSNPIFSMGTVFAAGKVSIFSIMTLLGIMLNNLWVGKLSAGYQDANSRYSAMSSWPDHLKNLPMAWMKLLGVTNMEGQKLMEGKGLTNLFFIITALLLAAIPVISIFFYPKYGTQRIGRAVRFWVWIHWSVTALVLIGYICGVLSTAEWRLTPIFGTSVILSILFVRWAVTQKSGISRFSVILALPVAMVCIINLVTIFSMPSDNYKKNDLFALSDFLEENDLEYGYATFWNTNSITVISGNKVKVREVTVSDEGVKQRHYQSSTRWYNEMKDKDKYFLLLSELEYKTLLTIHSEMIEESEKELSPTINDHHYHVLVYDHNIL